MVAYKTKKPFFKMVFLLINYYIFLSANISNGNFHDTGYIIISPDW